MNFDYISVDLKNAFLTFSKYEILVQQLNLNKFKSFHNKSSDLTTTFTSQVTFTANLLLLSAVACTATNRETISRAQHFKFNKTRRRRKRHPTVMHPTS